MSADQERGSKLAELARQVRLWLEDNELEHLPGIKRKSLQFYFYAGIYRKLKLKSAPFENRLVPNLFANQPNEMRRLSQLHLGISHVLLINNPEEWINLPDGRQVNVNDIIPTGKPMDQPGAYMTVNPRLDSMAADEAALSTVRNYDFSALLQRVDLVWDDLAAAKAAHFDRRYHSIFDYKSPRTAYTTNVQSVPIPDNLVRRASNNQAKLLAQRERAYREYLYLTATYANRVRVVKEGGNYYRKWLVEKPVNARQRQFRPTMLTDQYLKESFHEFIMKEGDNLLLIDLPGARYVYRLLWEPPPRSAAAPHRFTISFLIKIGDYEPLHALADKPSDDDAFDEAYPGAVTAVIFHALEGAPHLPTEFRRGKLEYSSALPPSYVVDYKAYVRWYYNDQSLRFDGDEAWFDRFVDTFFADQVYPIQLTVHPAGVNREEFFLDMMSRAAEEEQSPLLKATLDECVDWVKGHPWRYIFIQGTNFGTQEEPRELIGLIGDDVYEWHPATGIVTRMKVGVWLRQAYFGSIAADVYRSTAATITWIKIVVWSGVVVMTAGTLVTTGGASGLAETSASLANTARTQVFNLAKGAASELGGRLIAREVVHRARPFFVALLVRAVMNLIPRFDSLVYEFVYGLFEGFSGGAVEHYLSEIDERLERQIKKMPEYALNWATRGGYRAYVIYDKVRTAVVKASGVVRALRVVLVDDRAKLVAVELGKFSRHIGFAFLVVVFVVVYLDWVYRSRPGIVIDKWAQEQGKALQWVMIKTGSDIADYARDLKSDLLAVGRDDPRDPVVTAVVRKHDERLTTAIGNTLHEGVMEIAAVGDYMEMLLSELGIKNWGELKELGLTEILSRGLDVLPTRGLTKDQLHKVGAAVGELIGTLMLERRFVPEAARKNSRIIFPMGPHDALKGALAGGTLRALWRFAIFPLRDLGAAPAALKRGLDEQMVRHERENPRFTRAKPRDSAYREFVTSLVADEEELARRLANIAEATDIEDNLRKMVQRATDGAIPPSLNELIRSDNPNWPADAILFLLYSWLRLGLSKALQGFHLIEDGAEFGGTFQLSELFDILGLDVALDDEALAKLKTAFTQPRT
jgi:hypothetical protein